MLKSRIKKLEERMSEQLDDKVTIISVYPNLALVLQKMAKDDSHPISQPGETYEEFHERVKREGKNMGFWVMTEEEQQELTEKQKKLQNG